MNTLNEYKGYIGTIDYSNADRVFYGKLFGINDTVAFEGSSVDELEAAFKFAVDDYIKTCKKIGKDPEKIFKGSFNVRIDPDLHKMAAYKAKTLGVSLNEFVESAIRLKYSTDEHAPLSMVNDASRIGYAQKDISIQFPADVISKYKRLDKTTATKTGKIAVKGVDVKASKKKK